jgi:hypothetical protein
MTNAVAKMQSRTRRGNLARRRAAGLRAAAQLMRAGPPGPPLPLTFVVLEALGKSSLLRNGIVSTPAQ